MSENSNPFLKILSKISSEIEREHGISENWCEKQEPATKARIEKYNKISDSEQADPALRLFAGYVAINEANKMVILLTQSMTLNLMTRLAICTTSSIAHIHNELKRLEKQSSSPTGMDLAKTDKVEKELARLKRIVKQWKPIMDYLREAEERANKILGDHR